VALPHRANHRLVLNTNYVRLDDKDRWRKFPISLLIGHVRDLGRAAQWRAVGRITTDVTLSPRDFAQELREVAITTIFLTAALFNQLAAEAPGASPPCRR